MSSKRSARSLFLPSSLLVAALALAGLGGCAQPTPGAPSIAASTTAPAAASSTLKLERVVMLMRHGVRPPTKPQVTPKGSNPQPWPQWSAGYGELTGHGYDAVRLLGRWDRLNWAARGLLPATGCPAAKEVEVAASSKSRTQDTARALVEGLAPGCGIHVAFPAKADDVEFHPLQTHAMALDADKALAAVQALMPPGGMAAEVRAQAPLFALLNQAMGCTPGAACDLSKMPAGLDRNDDERPKIGDPFGIASTASQTFLLEYLQGMPMKDVAWGHLDREQIGRLLEFHALKFRYEGRAPYVAARAASPLAARMLGAVEHGPKLTVLVGHDTNIADLGGMLDLHWQVPDYPRDDPPPGGAIGFEVLANPAGQQFVRAFYRAQTMDQVRELQQLDAANAPSYTYLPIPGCAERCPIADFEKIVSAKLVKPLRTPAAD
ncbi:MAG TPA: histidine-type phosphatase [Rhodanobacter sp.]|nr:histidine-type phosphatase [Rhodanobacter sp.]